MNPLKNKSENDFEMAVRMSEEGNHEQALKLFRKLAATNANDADIYYNIACCEFNLGNQIAARNALRKSIVLNPNYKKDAMQDADLRRLIHRNVWLSVFLIAGLIWNGFLFFACGLLRILLFGPRGMNNQHVIIVALSIMGLWGYIDLLKWRKRGFFILIAKYIISLAVVLVVTLPIAPDAAIVYILITVIPALLMYLLLNSGKDQSAWKRMQ